MRTFEGIALDSLKKSGWVRKTGEDSEQANATAQENPEMEEKLILTNVIIILVFLRRFVRTQKLNGNRL
jgi:hypothetical protein